MRISNVLFGRTPLVKCSIKKKGNNENTEATLYKMDPSNLHDIFDAGNSKVGRYIYNEMRKELYNPTYARKFYMLQNDKTNEVISCAETSHRYRTSEKNPGLSTLIEEMEVSPKYVNGAEPILAYIAYNAFHNGDNTVYSSIRPEEISVDMKRSKFTQTKLGEWYIPQKRYFVLINDAKRHSQMKFLEEEINKDEIE